MSTNVTKGHRGYCQLKNVTADGTGSGNEVVVPYISASPVNPTNDAYIPSSNASSGPSILMQGIYTPGITIRAVPLESWFTPTVLNGMFTDETADYDTSLWAAKLVELGATDIKVGGLRWGALSISHAAAGNMLGVELGGVCTTFADSTVTWADLPAGAASYGQAFGPTQVDYNSTATKVRGWSLNLIRAQAYDIYSGGVAGTAATRTPSDISSGQIGGTFTLEFSPTSTNTIPGLTTPWTITIRLYTAAGALHMTLTPHLNLDAPVRTLTTGFGTQVNTYTLINRTSGGIPVTIA